MIDGHTLSDVTNDWSAFCGSDTTSAEIGGVEGIFFKLVRE
jgi:translation initiation factor 6 (eIF-6)